MTQANQDWLNQIVFPTPDSDNPIQLDVVGVEGPAVYLGSPELKFRAAQFVPGPANAGSVFIQVFDETLQQWVDALPNGEVKAGGQGVNWDPPQSGVWNGQSFKLRFTNAGDVLSLIYVA